jgi:hypothetical protein
MPLGELDRDIFRSVQEDKLAVVKIHDLVAEPDAGSAQLRDLGFEVVYREADVVEAQLVELGNVGIDNRFGVTIVQQLHFGVRIFDRKRDVVGLDVLDSHIVLHDPARDHDGLALVESEQGEEALRRFDIAYDDGDVIEIPDHAVLCLCRMPSPASLKRAI